MYMHANVFLTQTYSTNLYTPYGIRTHVYAVKERRPRPLDEEGVFPLSELNR